MGVVHHALIWKPSNRGCETVRAIWDVARTGDPDALSAIAAQQYRNARPYPDILAAFDLGDDRYVRSWISPAAFDPALAVVLAAVPEMLLLSTDQAETLAGLRRTATETPPLAPEAFHAPAAILSRMFGTVARDPRRVVAHLGHWARWSPLDRHLRSIGNHAFADRIATWSGGDPSAMWLVVNTLS